MSVQPESGDGQGTGEGRGAEGQWDCCRGLGRNTV